MIPIKTLMLFATLTASPMPIAEQNFKYECGGIAVSLHMMEPRVDLATRSGTAVEFTIDPEKGFLGFTYVDEPESTTGGIAINPATGTFVWVRIPTRELNQPGSPQNARAVEGTCARVE